MKTKKPHLTDDIQKFKERVAEVLREELKQPEQWFYLSFADKKFKGACFIKAHGITDATTKANTLNINPGGQVMCIYCPEEHLPAAKYLHRLLGKKELEEIWGEGEVKSIGEFEDEYDKGRIQ